jgi:hypothetical protein
MSMELDCNNCKQLVLVDSQGGCKLCGSHSVGLVDRFDGVVRANAGQVAEEDESGQPPKSRETGWCQGVDATLAWSLSAGV